MMTEVLPGLFHWYVVWPEYRLECYWLRTEEGSILIDPLEGIGLDEIEQAGDCRAVIITSHWHERSALLFAKRTGAPIYVPEGHTDRLELVETYHTYRDGDALPGGLRAIWVLDECALLSELHGGTLFVGDALGTTGKWVPGGIPLGLHPRGLPPRTDAESRRDSRPPARLRVSEPVPGARPRLDRRWQDEGRGAHRVCGMRGLAALARN